MLKNSYDLRKNDKMKKYEIKTGEIDIDIYVRHFSPLIIPPEKIEATKIEGFDVAKPEFLLALKQAAEEQRSSSEKGEKDRVDIINLLLKCDIDFAKYAGLLRESNKEHLIRKLITIVKTCKEYDYFGMNPREFKLSKESIIRKIREA